MHPLSPSELRQWLGWTGLRNEVVPLVVEEAGWYKFRHYAYRPLEHSIQLVVTEYTASLDRTHRLQGLQGLQDLPAGGFVPLSPNVALTPLPHPQGEVLGRVRKAVLLDGGQVYEMERLWFPQGVEAAQPGKHLTLRPDLGLMHVHLPGYELYVMKARVPGSSVLETFYPEPYHRYAFTDPPVRWLGYWRERGEDCLADLTGGKVLYQWKNPMDIPKLDDFHDRLALRLVRTFGGQADALFRLRALGG